jgi:hypothetical protein
MTDLDTRLRALDPIPDPATLDVSDATLRAGLVAILAAEPPTIWTRLRSRTVAVIAGFVAIFAVGTGIAFAAGIPADVRRAFADEPMAPGAPVPWNAHDIRLAATLPLDRGRTLQIWTAVNDLNDGPCTDYQLITPDGRARDRGHGCEGSYPNDAKPGVVVHDPALVLEYPSIDLQWFQPDPTPEPLFFAGRIYAAGVTRVVLRIPGRPDRAFTLDSTDRWAIVEMPAGWGQNDDQPGHALLYDAAGHLVSTFDLRTFEATPKVFYESDGTIDSRPSKP